MANKLSVDEKVCAVGMLCEGNSIRSVERMTGIHRDTVMRLGVRMGEGCKRIYGRKDAQSFLSPNSSGRDLGIYRHEKPDRPTRSGTPPRR